MLIRWKTPSEQSRYWMAIRELVNVVKEMKLRR